MKLPIRDAKKRNKKKKNLDYFCDDEELKYKLKKEYENERSIND